MSLRHTRDLALAAFMLSNGLAVQRSVATARGAVTEYAFTFDDPERRWDALAMAFVNSAEARFNEAVRRLKKAAKATGGAPC